MITESAGDEWVSLCSATVTVALQKAVQSPRAVQVHISWPPQLELLTWNV
jgi:hypothetical protein